MKFVAALCLAICLLVAMCHGAPVERETLLSIEQPAAVALEDAPQQLRRVARGFGRHGYGFPGGFGGGYGGFPGGGYGGYPGGGFGGFPGGGYGGGYGGASASASAAANSFGGGFYG